VPEHSVGTIEAGAAPSVPRPPAGAVAIVAAATATALGMGKDVGSTAAQIAAAAAVAAVTVAVVPLVERRRLCLLTYLVASAATGAAAIHYAVVAEHFDEWWGFGLFFLASAVAQLVWAVVVVASRSRLLIWLGVIGNAAIVVLWIVTRTVGTLVGPEPATPEPIGVADSVATAFELTIVVAGTWLARSVRMRPALSSWRPAWVVSGVTLLLTSVALLSVLEVVRS
jgi:hypothetical protein